AEVRGHERKLRFAALDDFLFRYRDFLAQRIHEHDHFALFAPLQAGDGSVVLERDEARTERRVNVTAWIEHIFDNAFEAAIAHAVKLRADDGALAVELVTDGAGFFENQPAAFDGNWGRSKARAALVHQLLQ